MLKPQKYNIEDTNIANLGSDLEKKARLSRFPVILLSQIFFEK